MSFQCCQRIVDAVTIGEKATAGSGSIVGRDVPPKTIEADSPARVVRKVAAAT